jgi:UDP-N-acetylglucosamine 2-epimerase
MKIVTIIGTRPEIIKMSPLLQSLNKSFKHYLIHTGQHYDPELDKNLFQELKLPQPNFRIKLKNKKFPDQLAEQLIKLQEIINKIKPHFIIVQGDTNSSLAGGLVAARNNIKLVHIESGCRSYNPSSPEEQNRLIIDSLSNIMFCSDKKSFLNLKRENKDKNAILTGSTTFDAIERSLKLVPKIQKPFNKFALLTLHRSESMFNINDFKDKIHFLNWVSEQIPIIFPIHPRTFKFIKDNKITLSKNIKMVKPMSHLEFLSHLNHCHLVLTDSGGIQEESAYLNKPCVVLRNETEWTRFIKIKKNFLVNSYGSKTKKLVLMLINDLHFYKKNQSIKCPESKSGATQKIIEHLSLFKRSLKD